MPMTKWGQLRLRVFRGGNLLHDHASTIWELPFRSYVEETLDPYGGVDREEVPAWRWRHRTATHVHRVAGSAIVPYVSIIWRLPPRRKRGYWLKVPEPVTRVFLGHEVRGHYVFIPQHLMTEEG